VKPEDRAAALARYEARAAAQGEAGELHVHRWAGLFDAIRHRQARDIARGISRPESEKRPPVSHPDHDESNVRPSAHVSGVTGR